MIRDMPSKTNMVLGFTAFYSPKDLRKQKSIVMNMLLYNHSHPHSGLTHGRTHRAYLGWCPPIA